LLFDAYTSLDNSEMKKIRIGNQTAFSAMTPMMPFEYAVAHGFDAFEWFPDKKESGTGWDENDIDGETRSYIKDKSQKHDIALSVHSSLRADLQRGEANEIILEDLSFAQDIGASLLNIHMVNTEGAAPFIESIGPVIRRTAEANVKLSIENTPLTGPEKFNELFRLLEKQKALLTAHVGMCLDLGHANLYGDTQNEYLKYIDLLGSNVPIIHMHMHENYGNSDCHLPFFTGPAGRDTSGIQGVAARMKKRNFTGSIILEQWPQPPLLLNEARDRLYHMFKQVQK
jgi:sugar phosphate isomerase/epimerase